MLIGTIFKHPEIAFSGWGVALIGFLVTIIGTAYKLSKTYKIIKKNEYDNLIKFKNNFETVVDLKNGLEFNQEFGIYIDQKSNENFCPTCLTDKARRNHVREETGQFGTTYKCDVCNGFFYDKDYLKKVETDKDQKKEAKRQKMLEDISTWNK